MASVGGLSVEMNWAAQEDANAPAPVLDFAKILAIVILFKSESDKNTKMYLWYRVCNATTVKQENLHSHLFLS